MRPIFEDFAKRAAQLAAKYYGSDELYAMTFTAVEVPLRDFATGNHEHVLEMNAEYMTEYKLHQETYGTDVYPDLEEDVVFAVLSTMLMPREFFEKEDPEKMLSGVMCVLDGMGLAGVVSREEMERFMILYPPQETYAETYSKPSIRPVVMQPMRRFKSSRCRRA